MIKIENYKPIGKGALVGSFSMILPEYDMTIRDCKYMKSNGKTWISYPSREYEKDGEKKYFSYVWIGQEMKDKIEREALEHVQNEIAKEPEDDSPF